MVTLLLALAILALAGAVYYAASVINSKETVKLAVNLNGLQVAVSNLETVAMPGENSADQAAVDQLTNRVNEVAARFNAPAPAPAPAPTSDPAPVADPAPVDPPTDPAPVA